MRKTPTGRAAADSRKIKSPRNDVVLWAPRLVVAPTLEAATMRRRRVTLEALASPAASATRLGVAESVLGSLADAERAHIVRVLEAVRWNKKQAAQILEISRGTLYRKILEYGLESDAP